MNVVHIRSYPSRPQDLSFSTRRSTPASSICSSSSDTIKKRKWLVSITVNDNEPIWTYIEDPFSEVDYKNVFEDYLRSSDRPGWNAQILAEGDNGMDEISRAEDLISAYGETLFSQLEPTDGGFMFDNGVYEAQIYVHEHHDSDHTNGAVGGIHCLAWELLELVQISRFPQLRLRVTRVSDFPARRSIRPSRLPSQRLAYVQADPNAVFKILLVIARDFSRTGAQRDPEPDLAQWPLMNLQKKLRNRLTLEVVRPGSLEELERHLQLRRDQKIEFNLVHFDLHGRIMRDETGTLVPWLLFAKQHKADRSGFSIPQTQLSKAESVAKVLSRYDIENVVLNACLSAYNRSGPATNLAHIFLRHGISNVSAMWFYVHWTTVATYVEAFYNVLLVQCLDFHIAAQRAREVLRKQSGSTTDRDRTYQDFFLNVNYAREEHRTDSMLQQRSPSPSVESVTSASNKSIRSSRSGGWKSSTPRLGDSLLLMGDEPIIRLQLHLLELEYKLVTFKIVYASDLYQAGVCLNDTLDKMVNMWLSTNLIDEVLFYRAKDFGRRRMFAGNVSPRERRTRARNGPYLQRWFSRPVGALRQTLHIVREVDPVVDPGWQADELENQRLEERRFLAQDGLQRFAKKLHEDNHGYMILLGNSTMQWWQTYLQHLDGEWWLHMPWSFTAHTRYTRDVKSLEGLDGRRPTGLGIE